MAGLVHPETGDHFLTASWPGNGLSIWDKSAHTSHSVIGEGIGSFGGVTGSGKSDAGALLTEQCGRCHIPMIVLDLEGDLLFENKEMGG